MDAIYCIIINSNIILNIWIQTYLGLSYNCSFMHDFGFQEQTADSIDIYPFQKHCKCQIRVGFDLVQEFLFRSS
jgi:hypothetical protein